MRILIVHNQLWAHYKSKLFHEIAATMHAQNSEDKLLVAQIGLYESSRSSMKDDSYFPYNYPYRVLFERSLDQISFRERFSALLKTYRAFKPDILNVTGYFDWAQILLMGYARLNGAKIVLSSESSRMDHNRSGVKEFIKQRIISLADRFFCFGTSSAEYLKLLGAKDRQIAVTHAAVVDDDLLLEIYNKAVGHTPRPSAFIYVGRLAAEKNLDMLLQTFLKLKENLQKGWRLILVGDGPDADHLKKLAHGHPDVIFAGGHPWYKVPEWLAKSDVLILPSKSEPWGLVVNEAMVCGIPVIVSDQCGCAEDLVKDGVNGFTFNPGKPEELNNAMSYLIQNPDKIAPMGARSKHIIQAFSASAVARDMVACYSELAGKQTI